MCLIDCGCFSVGFWVCALGLVWGGIACWQELGLVVCFAFDRFGGVGYVVC